MAKKTSSKSRTKGAISKSFSSLKSMSELEHLDGLSDLHRLDVESNWKLLNPEEADAERKHAAHLESYYFGSGRNPELICTFWFGDDILGVSEAKVMLSADWKTEMKKSDDARRTWRDGDRMRSTSKGKLSGNLSKIFARLPPWVAAAAGMDLKHAGLSKAVLKVAIRLEKETGLKILGAAIHRETDHDLHIHFIVSKIGLMIVPGKKYSPGYLKTLIGTQRETIRQQRRERGEKTTLKEVNEELKRRWETGEMDNPTVVKTAEYQKIDRSEFPRRALNCMGQAYCSKTNLWEASDRDPAVAAVQERHCRTSFRSVVQDAAAVAPDGDPAHKYWDYWLAKIWTEAVSEQLPEHVQERFPEVGRQAALRYILEGSSLPNPALEAARSKENEIINAAVDAAFGIEKSYKNRAAIILSDAQASAQIINKKAKSQASKILVNAAGTAVQTLTDAEARASQIHEKWRKKANEEIVQLTIWEEEIRRREIEMMTPPDVLETAVKLGFQSTADNGLLAKINEKSFLLESRDDAYFVSRQTISEPNSEWKKSANPIKNGLELIRKIWPKFAELEVVEKLASLFPNKLPAIVLSLGLLRNPSIWKTLLPNETTTKMPETGAKKNVHPPG